MAQILNRLGLRCSHEGAFSIPWVRRDLEGDGIFPNLDSFEADSSWPGIVALDLIPLDVRVLHQTRHPIDVAASHSGSVSTFAPVDGKIALCRWLGMDARSKRPEVKMPMSFWIEFWCRYNLKVREIVERRGLQCRTYQIEDLQYGPGTDPEGILQALSRFLDLPGVDRQRCDRALGDVPETTNGRQREHLDRGAGSVSREQLSTWKRFGYEPRTAGSLAR